MSEKQLTELEAELRMSLQMAKAILQRPFVDASDVSAALIQIEIGLDEVRKARALNPQAEG